MPNMSNVKNPMPEQAPDVRNKNFLEVTTGYSVEAAVDEAQRCLNCKNHPCTEGCPVSVKIPEFISLIAKGEFEAAYQKISETNALPAVCGRVCPQEKQCESKCIRGIKGEPVGIGRLERFAADYHMKNGTDEISVPEANGKKIAVVGSGPSGLTAAGDLAKLGYNVTMYEAFHTPGGVLMYGIPEFRLPKDIVQKEISKLKGMGVDIQTNVVNPLFAMQFSDCEPYNFKHIFNTLSNGDNTIAIPVPVYEGKDAFQMAKVTQSAMYMASSCDEREAATDLLCFILQCGYKYLEDFSLGYLETEYEGILGLTEYSKEWKTRFEKVCQTRAEDFEEIPFEEDFFDKMWESFEGMKWNISKNYTGVTRLANYKEVGTMPPASAIAAVKAKIEATLTKYNDLYIMG